MFRTIFDDFWGFDPFRVNTKLLGNYTTSKSFVNDCDFDVKDNTYVFSVNIPEEVKTEDIILSIEDENMLSISYSSETEKSKMSYSTKRSIPNDMDTTTLKAIMDGNKLIITSEIKTSKPIEIPIQK